MKSSARQVTPGASERSFGIQAARLAGLPEGVVGRATTFATLEESDASATRERLQSFKVPARTNFEDISPAQPRVKWFLPRGSIPIGIVLSESLYFEEYGKPGLPS